jgi:hypothetical protein
MSKGTKQIRVGKVHRFIKDLEWRLNTLQEVYKYRRDSKDILLEGKIMELELVICELKNEFMESEYNV